MSTSSTSIEEQITNVLSQHKVVIIQDKAETCMWCLRAKQLFQKLNIEYKAYSAANILPPDNGKNSEDKVLDALIKMTKGYSFVPMIFINGVFCGGYQQIADLVRAKQLMKLLHGNSKL
jgi:glutaredoxin